MPPLVLLSFRGAPLGASPESIAQQNWRPDGFSDAQLRIIARR
ncbi:hypothetical protein NK6_5792 [Bradyrhizobium diazoefficiens]|uniref:Uncharacterized protein n=1 Tax=Bradyrhizobium diazoefficiens TaxID=1355477 RepID=A0A0E4BSB5_9BRAD|nr:hypothetical protein NK6_5792 [Bradyrhizobium diazoefficiens]